jgi:uncharacterized protein involved in response to NO
MTIALYILAVAFLFMGAGFLLLTLAINRIISTNSDEETIDVDDILL